MSLFTPILAGVISSAVAVACTSRPKPAEAPSPPAPPVSEVVEPAPEPPPPAPDLPPIEPLPEGTTVLHIGDSFAGALGIELNKQLKERGVRGVLKYETASYIPTWAYKGSKLSTYIARYNPDLVLVTLGANELEIVNPEQRARGIRRIVERIGDRPCVWVAVPLWKGPMNGLLDVIRENCAPCVYMDTNELFPQMPRAKDNIHPSMNARIDWAKVVVDWLQRARQPDKDHAWALSEKLARLRRDEASDAAAKQPDPAGHDSVGVGENSPGL